MIKLLTFSDLFPNVLRPRHGIFVENRLHQLIGTGAFAASVIAPIATPFPAGYLHGARRWQPQIPARQVRRGIQVFYPRFPVLPGVTNWINPLTMYGSARKCIRQLREEGFRPNVVDAHFFYPAGVAAVQLGRRLGLPVVVTARGSDINVHTRYRVQRAWILWAARKADAVITVSKALRDTLIGLGVDSGRITVVRNGVDLDLFRPVNRHEVRRMLGWNCTTLLSVGNLVPEKGHDLVIEALADLPDIRLVVIGSGPQELQLQSLARANGTADRISWIPELNQENLARYYAAADLTVLASSREGMANVLLESLACGTRVVASRVADNSEIVCSPLAGALLDRRSPEAIVKCVRQLGANAITQEATRGHAERFGWAEPIGLLSDLLGGIARTHRQVTA